MADQNQDHLTSDQSNQAHIPSSNLDVSPIPSGNNPSTLQSAQQTPSISLADFQKSAIANSQDKYAFTKEYSFNPETTQRQNQNFERYYESPGYKKLGFNPWGDNEAVYNENTSGASDLWRASKTAMKLAGTGFMSPLRSYADILTGDPLALDYKSSREMAQLNTIGSSSRGGISGFTSNLVTNSGYTIGIVGEALIEEAVLTLALPETGGASGIAMAARAGKTVESLSKFYTGAKGLVTGVKSLKDFNTAKIAFNTFKSVGKFINPLENTVEALSVLNKSQNLTSLAKASNTAGAFFRDVRAANLVLSESKMEGAGVADEMKQNLVDTFYKENNRMPNLSELQNINKYAVEAGNDAMYANVPTIFLTNKVTFDGPILKGFKPLAADLTIGGVKVGLTKGVGYSLIESNLKNAAKSLLKPKTYAKTALNYFKGNLMEGVQESAQEVISGTAKDYYTALYKNNGKQGLEFSVGSYMNENLKKQFSGQGFETFASGFFMGGLIGGIQSGAIGIKNRIHAPEGYKSYAEYKQKKAEFAKGTVDKLNEMYKDPIKFLGSGILNVAKATESQEGKQQAELSGDNKTWQDYDDMELWGHVSTALETGTFDDFVDQVKDIRKMDPKAMEDAYGLKAEEVQDRLNKIETRAGKIKESYDYWTERAPNPFNPRQHPQGSIAQIQEAIAQKAWEEAKKQAVAYNYSFGRNIERMATLANQLAADNPVTGALSSDFTILTSPQNIKKELQVLNVEIKALESSATTSEDKKRLKEKKKKFESLSDFSDAHAEYLENGETKKLQKAYTSYIDTLADNYQADNVSENAVKQSFEKLKDVLDLGKENRGTMKALNLLSNPDGFKRHYTSLFDTFTEMYKNREKIAKEGVDSAMDKVETNSFLKALYERGFILSSEDAEKLLESNEFPDKIYSVASREVVEKGDYHYEAVAGAIQDFISLQNKEQDDISSAEIEMLQNEGTIGEDVKNKIAAKIRDGVKLSVNEQIVYDKLKDEIDLKVKEEPVVVATEIVGEEIPAVIDDATEVQLKRADKLMDDLQAAATISIMELDKVYDAIEKKRIADFNYLSASSIVLIDALYKNLRENLKNSVSFDDVNVDDVIIVEGGEVWIVMEKDGDFIRATKDTTMADVITIPKANFKNTVIMKIDKDTEVVQNPIIAQEITSTVQQIQTVNAEIAELTAEITTAATTLAPKVKSEATFSKLVDKKVVYNGTEGILRVDEGGKITLETDAIVIEFPNVSVDDIYTDFGIAYQEPIIKYNVENINEDSVVVNNVTYTINVDNKGNIISLSPENNPDQAIKNKNLIVAVEIERNKLEFNDIKNSEALEEIYDEVKGIDENKILETIYNINMNDTVASAIDKLTDGVELSKSEQLVLELWLFDALDRIDNLLRTDYTDNENFQQAFNTLEDMNSLLHTNKINDHERKNTKGADSKVNAEKTTRVVKKDAGKSTEVTSTNVSRTAEAERKLEQKRKEAKFLETKLETLKNTTVTNVSKEEEALSNESLKNRESVLTNEREEIEKLKDAKTKEELVQDFINELGCQ